MTGTTQRLGIKVVGSLHDDVEDPWTNTGPNTAGHVHMFERYGMAWIGYWAAGDWTMDPVSKGLRDAGRPSAGRISGYRAD